MKSNHRSKSNTTDAEAPVEIPLSEMEDSYQRWVALSAWLLFVFHEERRFSRAHTINDIAGDSGWARWHEGTHMDAADLREFLEEEIFPDLERYQGTGHPLALIPTVLREIPDGPLMSTLERARDCYEPSSTPPLNEVYQIWEQWKVASLAGLKREGRVSSEELSDFIVRTLAVRRGEIFSDVYARDGNLAGLVSDAGATMILHEPSPSLAVIAAVQAILGGQAVSKLKVYVGLPFTMPKAKRAPDVMVAIPPWGLMLPDSQRKGHRRRSELLFLEHVMDSLADDGRAAVVVPNSLLFGGAAKELRKRLLEEFRLDAVVNLPDEPVFQVGLSKTVKRISVKSAILYFSKAKPRENVWMVSEETYHRLVVTGGYDSPENESLIAALLARQGLSSKLRIDDSTVDLPEWLARQMKDLASPENPEGMERDSLEYQMLCVADGFQRGDGSDTCMEGANLVTATQIRVRDFELLPPRGSLKGYERFIAYAVEKHGAKAIPLERIAEVRKGRHIRPDQLERKNPALTGDIGVVRSSDFRKRSPWWGPVNLNFKLTAESASLVEITDILMEDDVLVCLIGDAGKVSRFSDDLSALYDLLSDEPGHGDVASRPSAVASEQHAVVRIRDEFKEFVSTEFLLTLIGSEPYREALLYSSRGSTVRQIRADDIRNLMIPVLPPAERIRFSGAPRWGKATLGWLVNALATNLISDEANRFFADGPEWKEFSELPLETPQSEVRSTLARLTAAWGTRAATLSSKSGDAFLHWMEHFVIAARELEEILSFPAGTDQLSALHTWQSTVRDSSRPFGAAWNGFVNALHEDYEQVRKAVRNRCEKLFTRIFSLSNMAGDALLGDIRIDARIIPDSVPANEVTEAAITIANRGPLPLRKIQLLGDGIEDRYLPILQSGAEHSWSVMLGALPAGRHAVNLQWSAIRLDENPASGNIELAIDVADFSERTGLLDLGESPYVYARVLDEKTENVFFGRKKAIKKILAAIGKRDASTIVLVEGNRRIGKTSLLKYFIRRTLPSDKVPVFINFQDFEGETRQPARSGIPTQKVFEGMAKELVDSALLVYPNLELPNLGKAPKGNPFRLKEFSGEAASLIEPDAPFASFRRLAEIVRAQIQPKSLLFIFDEFDRLQEGIESGITSDQVPENLRHLFQSWNDISGIFTGSRSIRRLRQEYWNILFGLGETVRLSGLDPDEARCLIEEPVKGRVVYAPKAVDEICRLTARQPLLIQGICERIFRECKETGRQSVDLSMVELVVSKIVVDNEHFESIWAYIGSDRRRLIVFLIDQQEKSSGGPTFEQMRDLIEECGISILSKELHADLDELEDLEVISKQQKTGIAGYRIEIPLFARWLRVNKDFSQYRAAAREEQH